MVTTNKKPEPDRVLIVEFKNGTVRRLAVPHDAKVTLSPAYPRATNNLGFEVDDGPRPLYLRVYRTANIILFAEPNVVAFHDDSLVYDELRIGNDGLPKWIPLDAGFYVTKRVKQRMNVDKK